MKKIVAILMLTLIFLLSGCIQKKQPTSYQRTSLFYNISNAPKDLVLLDDRNSSKLDILNTLFEGLVKTDGLGNIQPAIADNWEISEDGLTYKFHIRSNAKWSNGTQITAADFVIFLKDILTTYDDNMYKEQLKCIFGVTEYLNGTNTIDNITIKSQDDMLEIKLNHKNDHFLYILSQPQFSLRKDFDKLKNYLDNFKTINYTGPYKIVDGEDKQITIEKNNNYWNSEQIKMDKIVISIEDSEAIALSKLEKSKEMDIVTNVPISEYDRLLDEGTLSIYPTNKVVGLFFNLNSHEIINDINFRKAMNYSLNRERIVSETGAYVGRKAYRLLPTQISEDDINILAGKEDLDKAKEYFEKSGYVYNENEIVKIIARNTTLNRKICDNIITSVKNLEYTDENGDKVKLNIEYDLLDEEEFNDTMEEKNFNILLREYVVDDAPIITLEKWGSKSMFNRWGYNSKDYDYLITKAKYEKNIETQKIYLKKAEKYLLDDLPVIPLYFKNTLICSKVDIKGIEVNSVGYINIEELWISKKQ